MKRNKITPKPRRGTTSPLALLERERRLLERSLFRVTRGASGDLSPTSAYRLTRDQMSRPGAMRDWSVKDTLAWLVSWEQALLKWLRAPSRLPPVTEGKDERDLLDPDAFARLRRRALDDVVDESRRSFSTLMRTLKGHSGVGADIVALNLALRYGRARASIRKWMKTPPRAPEQEAKRPVRGRVKRHRPPDKKAT